MSRGVSVICCNFPRFPGRWSEDSTATLVLARLQGFSGGDVSFISTASTAGDAGRARFFAEAALGLRFALASGFTAEIRLERREGADDIVMVVVVVK